jgi:hypothetical protein
MGEAFQCERCQGYGPNQPVAIVTVASAEPMPAGKGDKQYDLCGRCLDELRDWLTPPMPTPPPATVDVPFGGSRYSG